MSGGSFNYAYTTVVYFCDDLENKIENNSTVNEFYECYGYTQDVIDKLKEIKNLAVTIASLMKEVEWLYSGDTGEETFMKRVKVING